MQATYFSVLLTVAKVCSNNVDLRKMKKKREMINYVLCFQNVPEICCLYNHVQHKQNILFNTSFSVSGKNVDYSLVRSDGGKIRSTRKKKVSEITGKY